MFQFSPILYVLALLLFLLPFEGLSEAGRVVLFASVLPGIIIPKYGIARKEFHFFCLATIILVATLISSSFAIDIKEAIVDLLRQAFILVFAFLLILSLRVKRMRDNIYKGLFWFSILGACSIFVTYAIVSTFPLQFITDYKAIKYNAQYDLGVSLNPLSFAIFLAYLASISEWQKTRFIKYSSLSLQIMSLLLSGSRTTILTVALFLLATKINFSLISRFRTVLTFSALSIFVLVASAISEINSFTFLVKLNDLTTGRAGLWSAALTKFWERPLTGWGAMSWHTNLNRFIPSFSNMNYDLLESGAFHNSFLTVLAEKGLIVFIPYMVLLGYFMMLSLKIAQDRHQLNAPDKYFAAVAPYLVFLMFFRAIGEQPGLLGYANGLVDFISYSIIALILAVATTTTNKATNSP